MSLFQESETETFGNKAKDIFTLISVHPIGGFSVWLQRAQVDVRVVLGN